MYRRALGDCREQGIDVVNLSIGGPGAPDPQEKELFAKLLASGASAVAAMGNDKQNGNLTSYPAAIPGVLAVGATSIDDTVADFSNTGSHIALSAPGVGIWSTLPTYAGQLRFAAELGPNGKPKQGTPFPREKNYGSWNGTSMATPHVTGAVALLLAKNGPMHPKEIREVLQKTTDKVPAMGGSDFHQGFGSGRLNLLRLLSS
jgi:subtilisin family serine protease